MDKAYINDGAPFHNNTDMMKHYTFKRVSQLNIVAIGSSDLSQFDFGVSVSSLSIDTWDKLKLASDIALWTVMVGSFLYLVATKLVRALRKRG